MDILGSARGGMAVVRGAGAQPSLGREGGKMGLCNTSLQAEGTKGSFNYKPSHWHTDLPKMKVLFDLCSPRKFLTQSLHIVPNSLKLSYLQIIISTESFSAGRGLHIV